MKRITPSTFCELDNDLLHLSYENMEWTLHGAVEQYSLTKSEVCVIGSNSVTILLKSTHHNILSL